MQGMSCCRAPFKCPSTQESKQCQFSIDLTSMLSTPYSGLMTAFFTAGHVLSQSICAPAQVPSARSMLSRLSSAGVQRWRIHHNHTGCSAVSRKLLRSPLLPAEEVLSQTAAAGCTQPGDAVRPFQNLTTAQSRGFLCIAASRIVRALKPSVWRLVATCQGNAYRQRSGAIYLS